MNRSQLEHAIRASCEILQESEVIIVGSQSILGSFDEDELPPRASMSMEIDILPLGDDAGSVEARADKVEGLVGELSMFESTHGFSIDGVGLDTCILPRGWRDRLVRVENANTRGFTGWCLDPVDLCVAKLCANREKDLEFVAAVLDRGLVPAYRVEASLAGVETQHADAVARALDWLAVRP